MVAAAFRSRALLPAALVALTASLAVAAQQPRWQVAPVRAIYAHFNEGRFLRLSGVHFDRNAGELFFIDASGHRVGVADRRGVSLFSFGSADGLRSPARLVVDRRGRILLADMAHDAIEVFDYDGTRLPDLPLEDLPPAAATPAWSAIALDDDERLYLADQANDRLVVAERDGRVVRTIQAPSERPELLRDVVDLEISPDGELVLVSATGLAVQVYDRGGRFLRGWGEHELGPENFSLPGGLAIDELGRVFVTDTLRQEVKIFSADGEFLFVFGGPGIGRGRFGHPVDVASDRDGRLFVTERSGKRVQVFEISTIDEP